MQTGMQLSFGKSMGKAAILKPESRVFVLELPNPKAVAFARTVIKDVRPKLPCNLRVDEYKTDISNSE